MHTNQVESPGLVCLGHGDGLKNGKKGVLCEVVPFLRSYHNVWTPLFEEEVT